ncbi:MAG: hypothetical protein RJQ00_02850 [Vicingaceae bacterium]
MKSISKNYTFLLLVLSLLVVNTKNLSAQNINDHKFVGYTFIDGKKSKDVIVKVFDDNKCISTLETKSNGKFVFIADSEKYYTLQFEKEGFFTKRIIIKTDKTQNIDFSSKTYKFDVGLVKKEPYLDNDSYDFPMAILELNHQNREFEFNKEYTKNRLKSTSFSSNNEMAKN